MKEKYLYKMHICFNKTENQENRRFLNTKNYFITVILILQSLKLSDFIGFLEFETVFLM